MKVDLEKLYQYRLKDPISGDITTVRSQELKSIIQELAAARAVVEAAKAIMNDETLHKWVTLEDVIKEYEEATNL